MLALTETCQWTLLLQFLSSHRMKWTQRSQLACLCSQCVGDAKIGTQAVCLQASAPASLAAFQGTVQETRGKQHLGNKGLAVETVGVPGRESSKYKGPNNCALGVCADPCIHTFPEWLAYLQVY